MKKIIRQHTIIAVRSISMFAFFIIAFGAKSFAQDSAQTSRLHKLLASYYTIKDAMVAGNNIAASEGAASFVKNINGISYQLISEGNIQALVKNASSIAEVKDIKLQRQLFVNFSSDMTKIAKALKMSSQPVFVQYCPMKKAYWLSNENAIKNPYYGSSMLTCGKLTDTIK